MDYVVTIPSRIKNSGFTDYFEVLAITACYSLEFDAKRNQRRQQRGKKNRGREFGNFADTDVVVVGAGSARPSCA